MKKRILIVLLSIFIFVLLVPKATVRAAKITEEEAKDDLVENLRYGFNVAGGQPIFNDSLKRSNPILRDFSEGLYKYVRKYENNSKTEAGNFVADTTVELASQCGQSYSGGINGSVTAVNVDIEGMFNLGSQDEKIFSERYEMYYQKIYRVSYYIEGDIELNKYLDDTFKKDLYNVSSAEDAINLYNKYGTHLFTGLQYGGLFQVTNYISNTDQSLTIKTDKSLSGKIQAAVSNASGGGTFNFSEQYATNEAKSYGTSEYKFATYGGASITAVSLDNIFTYNTSLNGKGNYIYDGWVQSINEKTRLNIIDKDAQSKAVPLWDLLPEEGYLEIKNNLLNGYIKLCGDKYNEFLEKYPVKPRDIFLESGGERVAKINGYTLTHKNNSSYHEENNTSGKFMVYPRSNISINCEDNLAINDKEWKIIDGEEFVEIIDSKNGIFKVFDDALNDKSFKIGLYHKNDLLYNKSFIIKESKFSGGDGTEDNPYLISTVDDLKYLCRNESYWGKSFKLTNDIDLNNQELYCIGNINNPFTGILDGNYCTIRNLKIITPTDKSLALFAFNSGEIKNLFIDKIVVGEGENDKKLKMVNYAGGLVGYNSGNIYNCRIENISLNIQCYLDKEDVKANDVYEINAGALVGYSKGSPGKFSCIEKSSVENAKIVQAALYGNANIFWEEHTCKVNVGGFAGYIENTEINHSYIRTIDLLKGETEGTKAYAYTGGLVGTALNNSKISSSISEDIKVILCGTNCQEVLGNQESKKGMVAGNNVKGIFYKCYTESSDINSGVVDGVYVLEEITYDGTALSSDVWCKKDNKPVLIEQTFVKEEALTIITKNVKTDYYYGEPFSIAGLKVEGHFSSKNDPITIDTFSYDNSLYNSNVLGSYPINVFAIGFTSTYNVTVRKINIIGLKVKPIKDHFYVNEKYNLNDFNINYVLENGDEIDINAEKLDYVNYLDETISLEENDYYLGDNLVKVSYGNLYGEVVIEAEEKIIDSINITKMPKKLEYNVGERLTLDGIEVTVTYENGASEIIDNSDLEIIGDKITEGINKIILSYEAYNTCELEVLGIMTVCTNHSYESVVTNPSCLEQGYTTHTCKVCNHTYIDNYVDALGHNIIIDEAKKPTFNDTGLTEGSHCDRCNKVLNQQEVINPLGYSIIIIPAVTVLVVGIVFTLTFVIRKKKA